MSKEHAERLVDVALDVIRVVLGSYSTRNIRLAKSRSDTRESGHMWSDSGGDIIHASLAYKNVMPLAGENWYEALMKAPVELSIMGSMLFSFTQAGSIHPFQQRFVDAIRWFGDAATETSDSSSIIKYVSAIERLFFGKYHTGQTKVFSKRVEAVLTVFQCEGIGDIYDVALEMYRLRSEFLHGTSSLDNEHTKRVVHIAEKVSRLCLLCGAQIYSAIFNKFENPTSKTLETVMSRITDKGVDWLVEDSKG